MEQMMKNCTGMDSKLADLLLDPERVPAKVQAHVAVCDGCRGELDELRATMALLDTWKAPEPSPYFLSKLDARMREEREAAPAGWLANKLAGLRASFAYGTGPHVRPLAATALAIVLLVGGGTYMGVSNMDQTTQATGPDAVVHDLQTLDNNAQLLDQMEAMSNTDNGN